MKNQQIICLAMTGLLMILCFNPLETLAQQTRDPFQEFLFPPELVMQHQRAIQLTDEQRNDIVSAVSKRQMGFTQLQWDLQQKMEILQEVLKQDNPNESEVESQMISVLQTENHIKILQIQLMVRIKNILTTEQKQKLMTLRKS